MAQIVSDADGAGPGPDVPPDVPDGLRAGSLRSIHPLIAIALFCAIYLQRFGLHTAGGAFVSAGQVIVLFTCLGLLLVRRAAVDLTSLLLLSAFLAYALIVTAGAVTAPQAATEVAPQSLFLLVTLYAVLCVVPVPMANTRDVLLVYNRHMMLLGILGILQFALQFAGIDFFSFEGLVPDKLLIEFAYNVAIPLNYGSQYLKSNGVFFLEPSFFSQFVAMALAAEMLVFRRPLHIAVYCLAIVVSYSGSGLLILAAGFGILSVLRPRYLVFLIALLVIGALALAVISQLAPNVYDYYIGRALEVRNTGSSGYLRYITPYLLLGEVSRGAALIFGYGPGAAEKFQIGFDYNVNAPVKIVVDYGLAGAIAFFGFFFAATSRRGGGAFLFTICMSWYFLGGGYQLTSCVIHTIAAFLVWSSWSAGTAPPMEDRR